MRWRGFEINYLSELEPPIVRLSLGSIMNKMLTLASGEIDTLKNGQLRESPSPKRVVGQLGGSKSTPMCIYKF